MVEIALNACTPKEERNSVDAQAESRGGLRSDLSAGNHATQLRPTSPYDQTPSGPRGARNQILTGPIERRQRCRTNPAGSSALIQETTLFTKQAPRSVVCVRQAEAASPEFPWNDTRWTSDRIASPFQIPDHSHRVAAWAHNDHALQTSTRSTSTAVKVGVSEGPVQFVWPIGDRAMN
jgi:hypothetical protein